jgi:hypothetical protein
VLADTAQGTTITGGGLLEIRGFNFVVDGVTNTSATQVRFAKSGDASTKFEVGANVDDKANPPRRVEANRLLVKGPGLPAARCDVMVITHTGAETNTYTVSAAAGPPPLSASNRCGQLRVDSPGSSLTMWCTE